MRTGGGSPWAKRVASLSAAAIGVSLGWACTDVVSGFTSGRRGPGAIRERADSWLHPSHRKAPQRSSPSPSPPLPRSLVEGAADAGVPQDASSAHGCRYPVVAGLPSLRLVDVASGLSHPAFLASPAGDPRLFVAEARGTVVVLAGGRARETPFLDATSLVGARLLPFGGERGLGAIAFHPRYPDDPRLFVSYLDAAHGAARVVELSAFADRDHVDPATARTLLDVPLPTRDARAAPIAFGPDGELYVGMSAGGEPGDPRDVGQRTDVLLGKILRIDVDHVGATTPYAIPSGNFRGPRVRKEIFASGVRAPDGLSFDRATGDLWLGDVGERSADEIDRLPRGATGLDLGWNVVEGTACTGNGSNGAADGGCDVEGLTPPVVAIARDGTCDVVGGYVYRGCRMPALAGEYIFGDRCSGRLRGLRVVDGAAPELDEHPELPPVPQLRALGEDADGELYVLSDRGTVERIEPRE